MITLWIQSNQRLRKLCVALTEAIVDFSKKCEMYFNKASIALSCHCPFVLLFLQPNTGVNSYLICAVILKG